MLNPQSHGAWNPADAKIEGFQFFDNKDGLDWYEYIKTDLQDLSTVKLMIRDGVVAMMSNDASKIVPPGEVVEVPNDFQVKLGWLWKGDHAEAPPPPPPEDPVAKLKAFLDANPDVRGVIG